MTEWADRIQDWDERFAVLGLYDAQIAAGEALSDAMENSPRVDGLDVKLAPLQEEYDRRLNELRAWYDTERSKIAGDRGWVSQERAYHDAREAYDDAPPLLVDEDGDVTLCAISGAPLYEDDVVIEIGEHTVLASIYVPDEVFDHLMPAEADERMDEAA